jgi:hypothetical protein
MTRHLFVESKTTLSTNRNILNQSEKCVELSKKNIEVLVLFQLLVDLHIILEHHEIIGKSSEK